LQKEKDPVIFLLMQEEAKKTQSAEENLFENNSQEGEKAEEILRRLHLRQTSPRKEILTFFLEQKAPVSVLTVFAFFEKKGSSLSVASVYRQIALFEEKGIVRGFFLNEEERLFEMTGEHHHHFVCTDCHAIDCVPEDESLETALFQSESALSGRGFRVQEHSLYFSGKCQKCAPSSSEIAIVL